MAESITDFSKSKYQYTGDDGKKYVISVRTVFAAVAATGLIAADGTEVGRFPGKPRHLYLVATTATTKVGGGTYFARRKVYYNPGALANLTDASFNGLDGLNWHREGHTGEKTRGA